MMSVRLARPLFLMALAAFGASAAWAQNGGTVYRCPGNPVLYTSEISAKDAKEKNCRTLEGAPVTVIQTVKPRTGAPVPAAVGSPAPRGEGSRVDNAEQRARDTDAKRILENELRKEEAALTAMQKEYNKGEPERHGDEKNYQKYLDRVAEMKANLARKENDVAALKRELAKLP